MSHENSPEAKKPTNTPEILQQLSDATELTARKMQMLLLLIALKARAALDLEIAILRAQLLQDELSGGIEALESKETTQ